MAKWLIRNKRVRPGAVEYICNTFQVSPLAGIAMLNRGLGTPEAVEFFCKASIDSLHPIGDIPQVRQGTSVIEDAIDRGTPITVYGDYDVDGVSSTVILYKGLTALGAKVDYFIPDRHRDGYGLNKRAIEEIGEKGCRLLITCDNGIAAGEEIAYARSLGMQVIILDHHEPAYTLEDGEKHFIIPEAEAVVDMKLDTIDYPFRSLCAGGLTFKFVRELFNRRQVDFNPLQEELAVFAALATVCDVVELMDENRAIVRYGLEVINRDIPNRGLKALAQVNDLQDKKITEYTFGFIIGPCINAGGRLETASLAAELFLTQDEKRIEQLAGHLYELNARRKDMTTQSVERLIALGETCEDKVLVMYDENVEESIAGIVAGRLKERFNKPSIVLTAGEGGAKGSGRSIDAYNMFEELTECRELFARFGGHKMAAGMTLPVENVLLLREALNRNCTLTPEDMERVYTADKLIDLSEAGLKEAEDMELFKPYGTANPEPIVAIPGLKLSGLRFIGNDRNIAAFTLENFGRVRVSAIWFDGESLKELINTHKGDKVITDEGHVVGDISSLNFDVLANLRLDEYMGNKSPKLFIKDMRLSTK